MKLVNIKSASIAGILCLAGAGTSQTTCTFQDGTFNNSDWTLTTRTDGAGGTCTATQDVAFGNPAASRAIHMQVNAKSGSFDSLVAGLHMSSTSTWAGAIGSLDWQMDYSFNGSGNIAFGLLARQGADFYVAGFAGYPFSPWTTVSGAGLTSANFNKVVVAGGIFQDSMTHPDFSGAGGPVQFGFVTANSTSNLQFTRDYNLDNWCVNIVPEPSTLAALAVAGIAALRRRRKL